jgi:hypothetical protein
MRRTSANRGCAHHRLRHIVIAATATLAPLAVVIERCRPRPHQAAHRAAERSGNLDRFSARNQGCNSVEGNNPSLFDCYSQIKCPPGERTDQRIARSHLQERKVRAHLQYGECP